MHRIIIIGLYVIIITEFRSLDYYDRLVLVKVTNTCLALQFDATLDKVGASWTFEAL
jgi:hypothetical protein